MKRKLMAALLTASMTAALLAGCGTTAEEGSVDSDPVKEENGDVTEDKAEAGAESGGAGEEEDLAEITVSFWSLAGTPDDANTAMVEDAINAITEKEINTTVNLNIMDIGSYMPQGAMVNGVANGEDFDLVLTTGARASHFNAMMSNGMLLPITDLLNEYAPELLSAIPDGYLNATTKDGEVYAVPSYCNKVQNMYWIARDSALEAANIDINSIKTIEDIEKALYAIKENTDMIPMGGAAFTINLTFPGFSFGAGNDTAAWDPLGENTAVAAAVYYNDDTRTAVSRYETEEFKTDIRYLKKWYDDGLLDKDVVTDAATANGLLDKDNVASIFAVSQIDNIATQSSKGNASYVKLADNVIGTGTMQQFTWALPVSCDEPEASVKFMNLLYTNATIVNLLNYGVEGTHYVKREDGTVGFPEGVTAESSGYYMGGLTALIGNGFLAYRWEGADPNSVEIGKKEMEGAQYSPLMGFTLDTEALGDVYTALQPIAHDEYGPALFCGCAPEGFYEKFIQKMKDAGLDAYLEQINEQIQTWMEQNQ